MKLQALVFGLLLAGLAAATPAAGQTPGAWGEAERSACIAATAALPAWPEEPWVGREKAEQTLKRMSAALALHQAGGICSGSPGARELIATFTDAVAVLRGTLAAPAPAAAPGIGEARQFSLSCVGNLTAASYQGSVEEDFDVDLDREEVKVDGGGTSGTYTRRGSEENDNGTITTYRLYDLTKERVYLGYTMINSSASYYHTMAISLTSGRYQKIVSREGAYARNKEMYLGSCTRKPDAK